jgi:MFS-type transporter involved in bile tolerance (Atg22 family)
MRFQFFALLGFSNTVSSIIGPGVIQAIIDSTGNNWQGFAFLFALSVVASMTIWFGVDVTKGRRDAIAWAESQKREKEEVDTTEREAES